MKKRRKYFLRIKRFIKQILGMDVWSSVQYDILKEFPGDKEDGWCIASGSLSRESIVYSIGVGKDISFDLALIGRYGCNLFAYDPTPETGEWIKKQDLPSGFSFNGIGVAPYDGESRFYRSRSNCFSLLNRRSSTSDWIDLPVKRFRSICQGNNHNYVDLLKLDIEGGEYEVLDDILGSGIRIGQILVEFHHRFESIPTGKTNDSIRKLNENGYRIFYISLKGREYSFIHDSRAKNN